MANADKTTGRTGWTTGTCTAAAAAAAARMLVTGRPPKQVELTLPEGDLATLPVQHVELTDAGARAVVVKDAGDDPDVTDGAHVEVSVEFCREGDVEFVAGTGVGTITKPGLQLPPGEPAINPVPRQMVREAIRRFTPEPVKVTVSIPGGAELAARTFNPRLGIEGGLSILGTTGIVRPFSVDALQQALACALSVAVGQGHRRLTLVPGNIGRRSALAHFDVCTEQVVEVNNHWGYMLDSLAAREVAALMVLGHPGKLAKLPMGHWNTHSSESPSALSYVQSLVAAQDGGLPADAETVGGLLDAQEEGVRRRVGDLLAGEVCRAVSQRVEGDLSISVVLVDYETTILGTAGDTASWR